MSFIEENVSYVNTQVVCFHHHIVVQWFYVCFALLVSSVFHMIATCFVSTYLYVIITLSFSMFFMWHSNMCFSPNFYVLDFMFCIGFYNFLLNFCFYQFMIMFCTYVLHSYILVVVLSMLYLLPTNFPHLLAWTHYG